MTTPSVGPISLNDVNVELGNPGTTLISLNDTAVRGLAGTPFATPGTTISLNDLRGKSSFTAISATGGTISSAGLDPGNGYRYHVFTAPGFFTVSNAGSEGTVEYLVVGGGGAGGAYYGGGGGAGGFRTNVSGHPLAGPSFTVSVTSYVVSVGSGGPPATQPTTQPGGLSQFGPIFSAGGGGGGTGGGAGGPATLSIAGGSGGGGGVQNGVPFSPGGSGNVPPVSPPQGNPGGGGYYLGNYPTGGGGGAGSAGGTAPNNSGPGGVGGSGSPIPAFAAPLISPQIPAIAQPAWISAVGPTGLYAGGGGGGGAVAAPSGGSGGGGNTNSPGINFTGGGGGGRTDGSNGTTGGAGIVIIRYRIVAP